MASISGSQTPVKDHEARLPRTLPGSSDANSSSKVGPWSGDSPRVLQGVKHGPFLPVADPFGAAKKLLLGDFLPLGAGRTVPPRLFRRAPLLLLNSCYQIR
jgi:hypothetical protein